MSLTKFDEGGAWISVRVHVRVVRSIYWSS